MSENERIKSTERAKILKALAHPSRIFIIERLNEKPYCVNELTDMIGDDTSTVSKHLSVLKNAGFIESRKEGKTVYYSVRCCCVSGFLDCVESVIKSNSEKKICCISTAE